MSTLNKEQERILRYLITLPKNTHNIVSVGNQMSTYPSDITDKELIQILTYLEQVGLISVKWNSVNHNNLNIAIDITVLPDGVNYFSNKKRQKRNNLKDNIKWALPLVVSIISLIWNIINTLCYSNLRDMLIK